MKRLIPKNESMTDRILRVLIGAGALSLAFVGPETPWGYLGLIPLATGLAGACPLYALLGMSSCPLSKSTATKS